MGSSDVGFTKAKATSSLPRLAGVATRHKGKTVGAGTLLAAAGLVWLGIQAGVLHVGPATATAGDVAPQAREGEADGPPATPTRERVRQVEERMGRVEGAIVEMRDRLGNLATKQEAMAEQARDLKSAVDNRDQLNANRFERIADKLDDIRDSMRRGR